MAAPTRTPAPLPRPDRGSARRSLVLAVGLVALLAVLAGCATFDVLTDLQGDLEEAGFGDVTTNIATTDASVLVVSADAPVDTTTEEGQDQAAQVVWEQLPRRFEVLRATIDGERREWTYAELEDELGPRPDDLDTSEDLGDDLNRTAISLVLGLTAAGVVGIGVVGLLVFFVVRANRRNAATRPRPHPQPWMPPPGGPGGQPSGAPVPPAGGWAPASAPPGPPTPTPPQPAGPSLEKTDPVPGPPSGQWPVPPPPPPAPAGRRPKDPDARRLGRRPRGPQPDQAHTPPGWG